MDYTPDPTDVAQPTDNVDSHTAAAEFRALKAYIAGLTLGNQNAAVYRKNLLDNGGFTVRQRLNAGGLAAVDFFATDRWKVKRNYSANVTGAVLTGAAVILNPAASDEYLGVGAGAVITAPTAAQSIALEQGLEFANVSHLRMGSANPQTVTLSGWINCPTTGTICLYLQNASRNRSIVHPVVIASAGTWQFISATFVLDNSGSWTATNPTDLGLIVGVSLQSGTTYQAAAADTWAAGDLRSLAGAANFLTTSGWVCYFHGLQLEVGGAATAFEKIPHALELARCERYYERSYNQNLTAAPATTAGLGAYAIATIAGAATNRLPFQFRSRKRIAPTMTFPTASRSVTAAQDGGTPTLLAGTISELGGIANAVGGGTWAVGHAVQFSYHADADF